VSTAAGVQGRPHLKKHVYSMIWNALLLGIDSQHYIAEADYHICRYKKGINND
jgi:hypothetical protein